MGRCFFLLAKIQLIWFNGRHQLKAYEHSYEQIMGTWRCPLRTCKSQLPLTADGLAWCPRPQQQPTRGRYGLSLGKVSPFLVATGVNVR